MSGDELSQHKWKQMTLGEVATICHGFSFKSENFVSNGKMPVIRIGNIKNWRVIIDDSVFVEDENRLEPYLLRRGDFVIALTGGDVSNLETATGRVGLYQEKFPSVLNQRLARIDVDESRADKQFIYFMLANKAAVYSLASIANGSAQKNLTTKHVLNFSIALPSLSEQKSIAAVLASLDDKIELLRAQNKTLEEMVQRLFREWFVDFNFPDNDGKPYKTSGGKIVESEYGETPEGWQTKSYTDLVNVLSGGTPKTDVPEYWNGQIPFFTPKDAKDTFYVDTTEKYITEAGLSACNSKLYPKDTVFITARGTVGKCALALRDMAMNQSCYALVGKYISNLFVFLLTKQLIEVIKKSASGAVFDAITVSTFHSLNVVLGDREVTDRFEALIRPMFNKIANNTEEIFKLTELRDQLLPKLMSAEIQMQKG